MPGRTIAIGDTHGHARALHGLLGAIRPTADDTIVMLGDYIDCGPDSRGVIELILELGKSCHVVSLLGNHEEMLLDVLDGLEDDDFWRTVAGGEATLLSYGCKRVDQIDPRHLEFIHSCDLWYESENHFFVHASYDETLPLADQPREVLVWERIRDSQPGPHRSGKMAVMGHTAQKDGRVLRLPHLLCIDTYLYGGGCLTAYDVDADRFLQVNEAGGLV
jgi:serine/threonine protein phosphatase 1